MQYEPRIRPWLGALSCVVTFIAPQPAATKANNPEIITSLQTMIETIRVDPSQLERAKIAEQLSIFIQYQDTSDLDALNDKVIDDIAGLLKDRIVRQWIARALGRIGKRASRAVPALESALKEPAGVDLPLLGVVGPSVRSTAIKDALRAITGKDAVSRQAN